MFGVGCAVVDAVVNSAAGSSAKRVAPQRMAAIGRIFESQGHLAKAELMYRRVLKAEPGNIVARERLEYIAASKSERNFDATNRDTRQAIAVADSLQPLSGQSTLRNATPETAEQLIVAVTDAPNEISIAVPVDDNGHDVEVEVLAAVTPETENVATSAATGLLIDADASVEPAEIVTEPHDAGVPRLMFAPGAEDQGVASYATPEPSRPITTVGYEGQDVNSVSLASDWTLADRTITVEQVARWMEEPLSYSDELFEALQYGENDGVKALAAVLLTDASDDDNRINQALKHAAAKGSDLLKVTALDALIQRGAVTNAGIDELLAFLANGDANIKNHAASSLRNCADSEWTTRCVDGLVELLSDENVTVMAMAASTLGDFGGHAAGTCGDLQQLAVAHTDPYVLEAVSVALQRILHGHSRNTAVSLPPVQDPVPVQTQSEFLPVVE
jgi:hypothetical protein